MKKILVIEDEQFVRENIVEILEASGYAVVSAPNGAIGAKLAGEHLPDIILCDVMMPELDGHGVLSALRKNAATANIPFIFLTARADTRDLRDGMNLGADDYITKPFRVSELLKAVEMRLTKQDTVRNSAEEKLRLLRANISLSLPHEFLTPLSGILGFSELLLSSYDSLSREEIMEMLEQLNTSARRIHHLVQNFLLYAKLVSLASERSKIHIENYDAVASPRSIIEEVIYSKAHHEERTEDITFTLCNDVPLAMSSVYFTKIVEEIIDNALKYSQPQTPITISTMHDNRTYTVEMTNHGRTMTSEQIAAIGAYTQFDRQVYEQQGSGLGLSITLKLLELHDGHFVIKSDNGKTVVRLEIPLVELSQRDASL
jgi:DNA-binding response OmpR family regulator/two-component sensor histidine kinase